MQTAHSPVQLHLAVCVLNRTVIVPENETTDKLFKRLIRISEVSTVLELLLNSASIELNTHVYTLRYTA